MTPDEWRAILSGPDYQWDPAGPGVSEQELADLAARLGRPLPDDYAALLQLANGAAIEYKRLWEVYFYPVHEVMEIWRNPNYAEFITAEQFPGAVGFGGDGSEDLLLFDLRPENPDGRYPVYITSNLDVHEGWEAATLVAEDFRGLLLLRKRLLHGLRFSRAGFAGSKCAQLLVLLTCPACGSLADPYSPEIRFQWGCCGQSHSGHVPRYQLGDTLQWQHTKNGTIRPWAYFHTSDARWLNFGDPSVAHLITRDLWHFTRHEGHYPLPCPSCGQVLEGAAVEIRDSVIRRAWTYTVDSPDALDNSATDYLVQPDGTLVPMTEWTDHPIETIEEEEDEEEEDTER